MCLEFMSLAEFNCVAIRPELANRQRLVPTFSFFSEGSSTRMCNHLDLRSP